MRNIIKIVFDDETDLSIGEIKPLVKSEDKKENFLNRRNYQRQFTEFEKQILEEIDESVIENYAEWNLDLVSENDIEEKGIEDFSDTEILEELATRKILGGKTSIISVKFIERFTKIMHMENEILLDSILADLEKKLKI